MAKKLTITLVVVITFIAVLGLVKYWQIQAAISASTNFKMPPEAVTTTVVKEERWRNSLQSIGSIEAVHGVTVAADLPGIVEKIAFNSGDKVRQGDVLVTLSTRQEQAQLTAAESRLELTRLNLERTQGLRQEGITAQADLDRAMAEHDQAKASVGEIRATIQRKAIRAPFSGVLGIRLVNLGQYLTSGQPVVPLQTLDPVYVNFSVPQQELHHVPIGAEVRVTSDDLGKAAHTGKITAIDSVVDPSTRNLRIQATFANPDLTMRPGMFVDTEVLLEEGAAVIPIPSSSIQYAPYGDSVFVVEQVKGQDGKSYLGVRQQFVKLGPGRGDQKAVLSGIKPGEEIVTSGVFKLRNGAAVLVNNEIQPGNNPEPKPEEN
ncbi:MAG TPA: efflux RND transporter periplasmic adaptor subunit [Candidatus Polarisedimenticolia bacterium]|nr:efflux RND transporter periplasmic adaptor subunit [Candidatus Polarisedimenticolia bacterium]